MADSPLFTTASASTATAGQSVDEGRGRIFPCEECGADLRFSIGDQQLKCEYCGHTTVIAIPEDSAVAEQDYEAMLQRLAEQHSVDDADAAAEHEVDCSSCGATVQFNGTLTSSACPYCGSPIQRDRVHDAENRIRVDGVLPFAVAENKARQNLTVWVKSRWFAPNDFLKRSMDDNFHGVYLPYFTFDTMTHCAYSGQRGDHYWVTTGSGKNKRRTRRTRWWPASGRFNRFFDDVLVLAVGGMNRDLVLGLEPWPLQTCIPFTQQVLAGFFARTYDIQLPECFADAKVRVDAALRSEVRRRIGGDEQRIDKMNVRHSAITFKHLLLPVWLLAYRYKEKTYRVMINAATGEVQGERPYSWVKIMFAVLAGLLVAGGLFLGFSR